MAKRNGMYAFIPVAFEISGNVNPNPEARIEVRGSKNRNLSALQYMASAIRISIP